MELLVIYVRQTSMPSLQVLSHQIEAELRLLHSVQGVEVHLEWEEHYGRIRLTDSGAGADGLPDQGRQRVREAVCGIIAEHILAEKEPQIVRELIRREYKFDARDDWDKIAGYCRQMLCGETAVEEELPATGQDIARRKALIASRAAEYLQEEMILILDGFIRFRLQDYMEELREVVEYAIDEFMMDRQYQEFISLLQYFVYIQEAKIPAAHLIHKGGHEFIILNDQMELIDANEFDATFKLEVLEKDINFEDMIVSTLITVSPATIYIHTREPEMPVIKTIMQIFEDRTTLCSYCRMCHSYLGEGSKQDQLFP